MPDVADVVYPKWCPYIRLNQRLLCAVGYEGPLNKVTPKINGLHESLLLIGRWTREKDARKGRDGAFVPGVFFLVGRRHAQQPAFMGGWRGPVVLDCCPASSLCLDMRNPLSLYFIHWHQTLFHRIQSRHYPLRYCFVPSMF